MRLNLKFKSGNSLVYSIVKTLSFFCIQLFYKNTYFKGIINIPKNAGILFAPNHQSAFLDALMVSQMLPSQNRFLIRADIFKGKLVKKILSSLNLLPIYRLSDGKKNMDNNEAIFLAAEESLHRKETIVIFPEGNQLASWQLRPLKKGYARIAFGTLKKENTDLDLYIVPVGINYYHFVDYRSDLVVEFGKAIHINDYQNLLYQNESKAINAIKNDLSTSLSELIFDIKDSLNHEKIKAVSFLLSHPKFNLEQDFELKKTFFNACNTDLTSSKIAFEVNDVYSLLETNGVNAEDFSIARKSKINLFFVPIFYLTYWFAKFIHSPVFLLIENLINTKVKDPHFYASIRFAGSFILFPLYYATGLFILTVLFSFGVASTFLMATAIASYFGILAGDSIKSRKKRKAIESITGDFDVFDKKIYDKVQLILDKLK